MKDISSSKLDAKPTVLVIDQDQKVLDWFQETLGDEPYKFIFMNNLSQAQQTIESHAADLDLILGDISLEQGSTGYKLFEKISIHYPNTPFCLMTACASLRSSIEALRKGLFDYIPKPLQKTEMRLAMTRALQFSEVSRENIRLRHVVSQSRNLKSPIIAESPQMKEVLSLAERAAPSTASVLIFGESGVGKEVIAKQIHRKSARANEVFVAVNCAALPENLMESELFGHKKGAFTGADCNTEGLVRSAQKGTLFLDEIGEVPLGVQAKLLRFLQESVVRPVGDTREIPVDVRIIAATNRNLPQMVKDGKFREDLYYRLNVIPLYVPPLRERKEDIAPLLNQFVARFSSKHNPRVKGFKSAVLQKVVSYNWPGNIRELENSIERAVVLSRSDMISEDDLLIHPEHVDSDSIQINTSTSNTFGFRVTGKKILSLHDLEKEYLRYVASDVSMPKTEIAERLGINRKTLYRKQKEYNLPL